MSKMTAFDMAWGFMKGESSNWDWYKKRAKKFKDHYGRLGREMPEHKESIDNWLEGDIEEDSIDETGPAVNDALASIGEPRLADDEAEPPVGKNVHFGNYMNSKLRSFANQRRHDWSGQDNEHRKETWNRGRDGAGLTKPSQRRVAAFSEDNPDPLDSLMGGN